jgi:hypothetical protein
VHFTLAFTCVLAEALALFWAGVAVLVGDEAAFTAPPLQPVRKMPSITSATTPKVALFIGKRLSSMHYPFSRERLTLL